MLSESERREIEAHLAHYPQKRAACIDALKIVQRHRGWISDESIADLAQIFDMSPEEIDSVATFYNLLFREPVGRHVILACDSVSCWIMGCERLQRQFKDQLGISFGQTSSDGRFTLLPVPCLGICEQAPALMIDDDVHGSLDTAKLNAILQLYR